MTFARQCHPSRRANLWLAVLAAFTAGTLLDAQAVRSAEITVKETTGIRRFGYPVGVSVPFPKGALSSVTNARMVRDGKEIPAQYTGESLWPDGSVQRLAVDFNAAIGPNEEQKYQLEYGADTKPGASPRGLSVTESDDSVQVGEVRFSKTGAPLLLSVKYRNEVLGAPGTGFAVVDAAGNLLDLKSAEPVKFEILKRGPICVMLRYTGRLPVDGSYSVPFTVTVEMPNSKSWIKVTAQVNDAAKRLRDILYQTPFSFGPLPWLWDFGTERWTYGVLRNASDSVILMETVKTPEAIDWQVTSGPKGKEQSYEVGGAERGSHMVKWGHIQDGKEVVAFGVDGNASVPGRYQFALDGEGHTSIRFTAALPLAQHRLVVYEHFVASPVQIGAATSASAMLSPLVATVNTGAAASKSK